MKICKNLALSQRPRQSGTIYRFTARPAFAVALAFSAFMLPQTISVCLAYDWGYDDDFSPPSRQQPPRVNAPHDSPGPKAPVSKAKAFKTARVSGAQSTRAPRVQTSNKTGVTLPVDLIVADWLNLLGLIAPIPDNGSLPDGPDYSKLLSDDQKKRFADTLSVLIHNDLQHQFSSIHAYWGELTNRMKDPDQRSNYRLLFRALLSLRADAPDVSEDEKNMLFEALGPKRIAEPGPPPLTEDAIHAYTDMACFLYDYSHPGKTVDADDNRELYGLIIRDKFKKAPSDRDRLAMNNFPLSWAKFRILYQDADEQKRKIMAEKIASPEGLKGMNHRNTMLETVLSAPTWKRFVISSNKIAAETGSLRAKAESLTLPARKEAQPSNESARRKTSSYSGDQ